MLKDLSVFQKTLLGMGVLSLLFGLLLTLAGRPQGIQTPNPATSLVPSSVANLNIITKDGRRFPLPPLKGGVVLIVSTTCPHCHGLLAYLRQFEQESGPLNNLSIVALEGPIPGEALIDSLGPSVPVSGPGEPIKEFAKKLGMTGTPMLLDLTPQGHVASFEFGLSQTSKEYWLTRMRLVPPPAPPVDTLVTPAQP